LLKPPRAARPTRRPVRPLRRAELLAHLIEHDHYHAGQIQLLRQQYGQRFEER
jgi:uncharacterized damage-inducible protein DinB